MYGILKPELVKMPSMRVLMVTSILLPRVSSLVPAKHFLIETEEGGQAKMKSDNRAILNQWKPSKFYHENLPPGMAQTWVTNGEDAPHG